MKCKPWIRHFQPPKFQCFSSQFALHGLRALEDCKHNSHFRARVSTGFWAIFPDIVLHFQVRVSCQKLQMFGIESLVIQGCERGCFGKRCFCPLPETPRWFWRKKAKNDDLIFYDENNACHSRKSTICQKHRLPPGLWKVLAWIILLLETVFVTTFC